MHVMSCLAHSSRLPVQKGARSEVDNCRRVTGHRRPRRRRRFRRPTAARAGQERRHPCHRGGHGADDRLQRRHAAGQRLEPHRHRAGQLLRGDGDGFVERGYRRLGFARHHGVRLRPDGVLQERSAVPVGPRPRIGHDQPAPAGAGLRHQTERNQKTRGNRKTMRVNTFDHRHRLAAFAVAPAAAALVLAGCSSTANPPAGSSTTTTKSSATTSASAAPTTGSSGASTTASIEIGNTINYGSMSTTTTLDCASGKSLNVGGSDNTLTITGTCETATVTGTNNKITFDKVNTRITVLGMNNTITYKDGDPKVDMIGQSNTINKG